MGWRSAAGTLAAMALLVASRAQAAEPIERISEILATAAESWEEPGFRIQLRVGTEQLSPMNDAPEGGGLTLGAEPGVRLSRYWSLSANLRYTVLSGEMMGLRWSTTADVSFHPFGGLYLAAGVGYAGMLAQSTSWIRSQNCTGSGVAILGRIGWLIPLGDLFATGPMIQSDLQWTRCNQEDEPPEFVADDGLVDPEPSRARSYTWRHRALHFSWSLAWR